MKTTTPKRVKTPQDLLTTACYEVIYCIRDIETSPEVLASATKHAKEIVRLLQTIALATTKGGA